jgi:hypothetical protein
MGSLQQVLIAMTAGGGGSGAAPDTITGCTSWFDFTDITSLYTDNEVTNISSDGTGIQYALSKISGHRRVIYQTSGAAKPVYKTGIVNGHSVARCDGTNTTADFESFDSAGPPPNDEGRFLKTEAYTAAAKTLIVAVSIPSAASDAGNFGNGAIVGDAATNRFGLFVYELDASNVRLQAINYDGSEDVATVDSPKSTWAIVSVKHDGTDLKIRINHGSWSSVASGTSASFTTGGPTFANSNAKAAFDCAHVATFNTAVSDADIYLVEQYMADQLAITLS